MLILCEQSWYFAVSNEYIAVRSRTVKKLFQPARGTNWCLVFSFPISSYFDQVCSYLSFERPFLEMFS